MARWTEAKVTRKIQESPRVSRIWLKPDTEIPVTYVPGQFITLDLPVGEKRLQRWKSYSIADITEDGEIELCVGIVPGGPASTYLCQTIEVGSPLVFKGPEGTFVLPESLPKEVVFICTGTGVVPFIAMLKNVLPNQQYADTQFHLIFGIRFEEDILYTDLLNAFKAYPNFKLDIALSQYNGDKPYHKGYVHSVYLNQYNKDGAQPLFFLCGWQAMIDEAVLILLEQMQIDRSQIKVELYG